MRRHLASFAFATLLGPLAVACGEAAAPAGSAPSGSAPVDLGPLAPEAAPAPEPPAPPSAELTVLGEAGRSSPIVVAALARPSALVNDPHGRVLLVADEEGDAVRVLDATSGATVSEKAMPGGPTQVLALSGDRVLVALRRESAVAVLALSAELTLREVARARTAEEPVAMAFAEDPPRVLVASGFGHALEGFAQDARGGLQKAFEVDLPREPRSVVAAGGHAFVSHMVGSTVSDVDLRAEPPQRAGISLAGHDIAVSCGCMSDFSHFIARSAVQGFAATVSEGRLWLPGAFSRPRSLESSAGYGSGNGTFPPADAELAFVDLSTGKLGYRVEDAVIREKKLRERFEDVGMREVRTPAGRCLLPRAIAPVPSSKRLLVACLGSDEVVAIDTTERAFVESSSRAFRVASGPVGLAVDEARREAFVLSAFDRAVSVLALAGADEAPGSGAAKSGAAKAGVGGAGARPGVGASGAAKAGVGGAGAKAGGDDAAVPVRSFALAPIPGEDPRMALGRKLFHATFDRRVSRDGRACASCHPDGRDDGLVWSSPRGPLQTPMLAGRLAATAPYGWVGDAATVGDHLKDTFGRLGGKGLAGAELDALITYVTGLAGPTRHAPAADARVARGKEIFESVDAMCTICHTESGRGTDGARHDVGSGLALETPTLRFVAGTAPYFHDGRYPTLRDLLKGSSGKMGGSLDDLGDGDLDALEAYLQTL